jgi:hypothetical protein
MCHNQFIQHVTAEPSGLVLRNRTGYMNTFLPYLHRRALVDRTARPMRTFHVLGHQQRRVALADAGPVKLHDVAVVVQPLQDAHLLRVEGISSRRQLLPSFWQAGC